MAGVDDAEAEEVLAEFDFLVSEQSGEGAGEAQSHGDGPEWGKFDPSLTSLVPSCRLPHSLISWG